MQPVFVILISRRKEQQIIRKAQKLFHITICISLSRIQSPSKKTKNRRTTINIMHDNPTGRHHII
jgi:hypothetical protein